jgi:hypothetical protein
MFHFVASKCTISEFCIAILTTLTGELPWTTAQGSRRSAISVVVIFMVPGDFLQIWNDEK